MDSHTKNLQSAGTLRAMLERAYGPGSVPSDDGFAQELGEGNCNSLYRAELRDGRRVVLKIGPSPEVEMMSYERDLMRTEVAAIRLVRERTSIPVPGVDHFDGSRDLIDAEWFAMPYLDGDNFGHLLAADALSPEEAAHLHAQLGAMTRELNTIVGPGFGGILHPAFDSWRDAFAHLIEETISDGERASAEFGVDVGEIRCVVAEHADDLDAVAEPRFIEWDLWPQNAIVRGGDIVGIVDHERASYGDPIMEAGFAPIDIPVLGGYDDFVRGYGHAELTASERRRRLLYTVYLDLVLVAEVPFRQYDDTSINDYARAALPALLDRLREPR